MTVYHDTIQGIFARILNDPAEYARLQKLGRICASQCDWNAIAASDSAAL